MGQQAVCDKSAFNAHVANCLHKKTGGPHGPPVKAEIGEYGFLYGHASQISPFFMSVMEQSFS
jgi:hypothetical protein